MKNKEKEFVHYSKNSRGKHVLFCRPTEGVWGFQTTGIQERVTCKECQKLLGRALVERFDSELH